MARFDGKVVLVSGGARGQGAAEARMLVAEGARVVLGDVLEADGERLAAELGPNARFLRQDVTAEADWARLVSAAEAMGGGGLHGMVNNAGIYVPRTLMETDAELFERHMRVNQLGCFLGIKAVVPAMERSGGGSIVNISSTAGLRGSARAFAYGATKWALRGMTKSAAMELAPRGIRVNSVHPGPIDTAMLHIRSDTENAERVAQVPMRPHGHGGGGGAAGGVPPLGRERLHDGRRTRHRRRRVAVGRRSGTVPEATSRFARHINYAAVFRLRLRSTLGLRPGMTLAVLQRMTALGKQDTFSAFTLQGQEKTPVAGRIRTETWRTRARRRVRGIARRLRLPGAGRPIGRTPWCRARRRRRRSPRLKRGSRPDRCDGRRRLHDGRRGAAHALQRSGDRPVGLPARARLRAVLRRLEALHAGRHALPHADCPMAVALRENRPLRGEAIAERPDGTRVSFSAFPAPLRDAEGAVVGAVNVLVDITEQKTLEHRLTLANADLALLSTTDCLTGLANRRHFDQVLAREWQRAGRERQPLSILLLDADCFKAYNDAHGHPAGDEVLKAIAACASANLHRPTDLAARYGGEEFAAILPNTDINGAVQVAEGIRRAVMARGLPHGAADRIRLRQHRRRLDSHDGDGTSLLGRADAALYEAKRLGRNRTEARFVRLAVPARPAA